MIVFYIKVDGDACDDYYVLEKEFIALRYDTYYSIVNKTFEYTYNDIKFSIEVYRWRGREDGRFNKNICGISGYDWAIESLLKFGKIISIEDQRKQREKRLSNL